MKKIYEKIWEESMPYQDKRDDEGHARTVTRFAIKLLETEPGDEEIVIPSAILHDIGWSKLSQEERFYIFNNKITKEKEMQLDSKVNARVRHEIEGADLAEKILFKVRYDQDKTNKVTEIIMQHDTNDIPINDEDKIMKDADKLWTFSRVGIDADARRFGFSSKECVDMAEKRIALPNYFHTESAKKIAGQEILKRKDELLGVKS